MLAISPNTITLFRIGIIPFICIAFYWNNIWSHLVVAAIFAVGGISDWLDGHLARKHNLTSRFGAFLDPVADKLLIVVPLCLLLERHHHPLITSPIIVIIVREIIMSSMRQWTAETQINISKASIPVSNLGKWKTGMQIGAIIGMLLFPLGLFVLFNYLFYLAVALLYIAAILSIISVLQYVKYLKKYENT